MAVPDSGKSIVMTVALVRVPSTSTAHIACRGVLCRPSMKFWVSFGRVEAVKCRGKRERRG
jgi:hypothetical protein